VTYTSGSTGAPKGVCLGVAQLDAIASSLARATGVARIERHLCLLPLRDAAGDIAGHFMRHCGGCGLACCRLRTSPA